MRVSGRVAVVVGLMVALASVIFGKPDVQKVSVTSSGRARTYWLFVPEAKDPGPRPILLLLHGSRRNGETLVVPWKDLAQKEGIVLAGPDSLDSVHWTTPTDGPELLRDVVDDVAAKTPIDLRRVYLFGHSAGACMALEMGAFESNYFAAVAIHAGAIPTEDFGAFDWAKRKIPYAFWIGTRDQFFALDWVRANRDALKSRGFPVAFTEMPGHDHNYYSVAKDVNRQAWDFLKPQRLPADPIFATYGSAR
ncbi:MAG TPA: PHB depolymerase family esterase [Thermoanaerobaculia bacterium]|nr:PHB depolymerase family esterase [Thermoanaerobaculia bacterium]